MSQTSLDGGGSEEKERNDQDDGVFISWRGRGRMTGDSEGS